MVEGDEQGEICNRNATSGPLPEEIEKKKTFQKGEPEVRKRAGFSKRGIVRRMEIVNGCAIISGKIAKLKIVKLRYVLAEI